MVERAKLAEANGYDTLWVADERFYREVYATLAILAQHTTRVKLGTCVTDPFARHPALTAMAIATLDEISNQRAILGFGAGISGFPELGHRAQEAGRRDPRDDRGRARAAQGRDGRLPGRRDRFNNGKLSFKPVRADIPDLCREQRPAGPARDRRRRRRRDHGRLRQCRGGQGLPRHPGGGREDEGPRSRRGEGGAAPQCLRLRPTAGRRAMACGSALPACWRRAG